MNKKFLILLAGISLLACNFLFPKSPVTTQPPNSTPQISEPETILQTDDFVIVRLHPQNGDLSTQLAAESQTATDLGLIPVVEFDATWCPPCQAIDSAVKDKNKLMMDAYSGTYIIKLDVDEWGWQNGKIENYKFDAIPVYFKLDKNGKATGETVNGGAWGEDIPENIAPVMDKFFHGS
jgi:thiol-disulfide isomerase/thioredoxin